MVSMLLEMNYIILRRFSSTQFNTRFRKLKRPSIRQAFLFKNNCREQGFSHAASKIFAASKITLLRCGIINMRFEEGFPPLKDSICPMLRA